MCFINQTAIIAEVLLIGFQGLEGFREILLLFLLIILIMTISGNLLIIWLVTSNLSLQSPMYFFLTQLSLSDLLLTTDIVPNTLYIIWNDGGAMSFSGCTTQLYFFACSEAYECLLLAIMAFDRYLAICNPLRYSSIMSPLLCIKLSVISWILSFSIELIIILSIIQLDFSRHNVIDHFFCDFKPLLELSCSDTSFLEMEALILCFPVTFAPVIVIMVFYAYIVQAALRVSNINGRSKIFSTCSSHLTVVSIFYGSLTGIYMVPSKGKSLAINKIASLLYTVITPMVNPIIYSLRNADIRNAIKKGFCKKSTLSTKCLLQNVIL